MEPDKTDKLWWTTVRPDLAQLTSWPRHKDTTSTLGDECPACGDTYHDLQKHFQLNYKGCADA